MLANNKFNISPWYWSSRVSLSYNLSKSWLKDPLQTVCYMCLPYCLNLQWYDLYAGAWARLGRTTECDQCHNSIKFLLLHRKLAPRIMPYWQESFLKTNALLSNACVFIKLWEANVMQSDYMLGHELARQHFNQFDLRKVLACYFLT
jgi:hypothetical protein